MPIDDGTLGGAITEYIETFSPVPPPISEFVTDFTDVFVPGGPPVAEGTPGGVISDFVESAQPQDPMNETFTPGLLDVIQTFGGGFGTDGAAG